jgi:steroid 5-alpha reductase family enzyme
MIPSDPLTQFLVAGGGAAVLFVILWAIQWARRDASLVDVGWAGSVGLIALFFAAGENPLTLHDLLVTGVAAAWSFRLAGYLLVNRVIGKPEDGRYQRLREHWGDRAQPWFFLFFQAQALLALMFAAPMRVALAAPGSPLTDALGLAVGVTSILGESLADAQLAAFRANPANRGTTCRAGLWRYSRHPNYFFEWLHWWAYPLLAYGSWWWWVTLFAPALMLLFLYRVTGIPATEAQAVASRGDDYRRYQRETSPFIPWFPNRAAD